MSCKLLLIIFWFSFTIKIYSLWKWVWLAFSLIAHISRLLLKRDDCGFHRGWIILIYIVCGISKNMTQKIERFMLNKVCLWLQMPVSIMCNKSRRRFSCKRNWEGVLNLWYFEKSLISSFHSRKNLLVGSPVHHFWIDLWLFGWKCNFLWISYGQWRDEVTCNFANTWFRFRNGSEYGIFSKIFPRNLCNKF